MATPKQEMLEPEFNKQIKRSVRKAIKALQEAIEDPDSKHNFEASKTMISHYLAVLRSERDTHTAKLRAELQDLRQKVKSSEEAKSTLTKVTENLSVDEHQLSKDLEDPFFISRQAIQ